MALILPALAFVAIVFYELFSKAPSNDEYYPAIRKVKPAPRHRR